MISRSLLDTFSGDSTANLHQGGEATFSNAISQSCFEHLHLGKLLSTEEVPTGIETDLC